MLFLNLAVSDNIYPLLLNFINLILYSMQPQLNKFSILKVEADYSRKSILKPDQVYSHD